MNITPQPIPVPKPKFSQTLIMTSKVISAVIAIGATVLIVDKKFDDQASQDSAVIDSLSLIMETVHHINVEQQFMAEDIRGIKDTMRDFSLEQEGHHRAIQNLGWAISQKENFTPEQLEEVLSRMLNGRSYYGESEIVYIPIE